MIFRVGGRRSKWPSSRTFQGYDQVRYAFHQGAPKMVIRQKESKNELLRSKVYRSGSNKIKPPRAVGNKKKSFVDIRLRHGNEILKVQSDQFQLCYRSPTTIISNGKLLSLLLLCHF